MGKEHLLGALRHDEARQRVIAAGILPVCHRLGPTPS